MNILRKISLADLVTLTNGLLGFLAILYLFDGGERAYSIATTLIFLAIFTDGVDGYVARRTQSKHHLGAYFDSMSDTVSFCFAPAILIYANFYDVGRGTAFEDLKNFVTMLVSSAAFLLGVIRLAQFSYLKEDELAHFEGICTPAMTYFIIIFVMLFHEARQYRGYDVDYIVLVVIIILSTLMLSGFHYPKIRGRIVPVALLALILAIVSSLMQCFWDSDLKYIPTGLSFLLIVLYFLSPVFDWAKKQRNHTKTSSQQE